MADGGTQRVTIPYAPRPQFKSFHDRSQRWACLVAHRRAGKTVACINELIRAACLCDRPEPRFAYIAPYYAQAKDVAWSYLKRFTLPIPGVSVNESELRVDLPNEARVRLYGADNYDRLRGTYFDGIVLDEYGDMDPRAWAEVIRPALADRQGWAVFIGTPKGRNHFCEVWESATNNTAWFSAMLKASQTGLVPEAELIDARASMTADQYEQEFECSFQAAVVGAYYGREMGEAEASGRITRVPREPAIEVITAWDLGYRDSTAIWFVQIVGREVRIIDYLENSGVGIDWYAAQLRTKPYIYGECILPHDAEPKELTSDRSIKDALNQAGFKTRVLPQHKIPDGINAARLLLPKCVFDATACKRGLEALRMYRREWDEKRKSFHDRPLHDWTSHGADAWRYLAMGLRLQPKPKAPPKPSYGWVV